MNAFVDPELCIGCTQCAGLCPAVFRIGSSGCGRARPHPAGGGAAGRHRSPELPGKRHPH